MPLGLLVAVFIVVPLAELYLIIQVGEAIGALWTIAILLADSILGSLLLRSQGRAAWRRFQDALAAGRMPHREVMDGVLVIFGAAFLITPGFLTDVAGLFLLLPPTRALIRRTAARVLQRRAIVGAAGVAAGRRRPPRPGTRPYDVEGTATEHPLDRDAPRLPR